MAGAAFAVREMAPEPYREEGGSGPRLELAAEDGPPADAHTEADRLEELGNEIARLAAHSHAATRRLLALVAEFDRRRGWEPGGHRSCAHWLAFRTGYRLGTAREYVRVARALETLPRTGEAMARGRLSFCQVRALTRVATPEHEHDLLALAEGATTAQLERMVRAWKKGTRQDEAARERERHRSRRLAVFPDDDGMYVVRGRLTPEAGAVLARALEAAEDALFKKEGTDGDGGGGEGPTDPPPSERARRREASRRRADAAGLVAERALAAGFAGPDAPVSGTRAERYQVLLHVDREALEADGEPGRSELADGTRVSPLTASLSNGYSRPFRGRFRFSARGCRIERCARLGVGARSS